MGPLWNEEEAREWAPDRAGGGKRLFFLLASLSLALLLLLLWLLFFLLEPRMASVGAGLVRTSRVVIALVGLAAVAVVASDFLSARVGVRLLPGAAGQRFALQVLLPVSERLGRLVGVPPDRVKAGFIDFNNALLRARLGSVGQGAGRVPKAAGGSGAASSAGEPATCCGWAGTRAADETPGGTGGAGRGFAAGSGGRAGGVLLLLPHCLQSSDCGRVLGEDVQNCGECGKCAMCELKGLVPRYEVENRIVGGGSLALMAVRELKPRAVVGVACERELVAAIRELRGVPVMAIPNCRPEGPCRNTRVDVPLVEQALRILLKRPNPHCSIH